MLMWISSKNVTAVIFSSKKVDTNLSLHLYHRKSVYKALYLQPC